jgi:hypothetical protein
MSFLRGYSGLVRNILVFCQFLYRGFDDALTELVLNDGGILVRNGDVYEGGGEGFASSEPGSEGGTGKNSANAFWSLSG